MKGQLYSIAFDAERTNTRTFKLDRGDPRDVTIRLAPAVARYAAEYPLVADQLIRDGADGGVTITARVSGLQEALRWTLGWGRHAEVLSPGEGVDGLQSQFHQWFTRFASVPGGEAINVALSPRRARG